MLRPGIELEQRFDGRVVEVEKASSVPADVFDRNARLRGVPTLNKCRNPETQIEPAGMYEQPLQDVLVSSHVRAPKSTGLVEMRTRSPE